MCRCMGMCDCRSIIVYVGVYVDVWECVYVGVCTSIYLSWIN